jgi:hypothetical protein
MKPYFYLSCARSDIDPYLQKFFRDLSDAVAARAGLPAGAVAGKFFERDVHVGGDWDAEVIDALQVSRTIVCIYSPAYFNSEYCGKEVGIFLMRRELYMQRERAVGRQDILPPAVIKPVPWIPLGRSVPDAVPEAADAYGDPTATHNLEGLRRMVKAFFSYNAPYSIFIEMLARLILETAERVDLPPLTYPPPLHQIRNPFQPNARAESAGRPPLEDSAPQATVMAPPRMPGVTELKEKGGINMREWRATGTSSDKPAPGPPTHAGEKDASTPFGGIFISYRRNEASAYAGRLYDRLAARFGRERVFIDTENVGWGEDFVEAITAAAESCAVMIALISPRWSRGAGAEQEDYVRLEVAKALGRKKIPVIPILIQGAAIPPANELPEDLAPLVRRNALALSDTRWERDVEDLLKALETLLKD